MSDFKARMQVEYSELCEKAEKLDAFINSNAFVALSLADKKLLASQLWHMQMYSRILYSRMKRARCLK